MCVSKQASLLGPAVFLGNVRGKACKSTTGKNFVAYLGVPYAVPPIGNLRFARPVELTPGMILDHAGNPY